MEEFDVRVTPDDLEDQRILEGQIHDLIQERCKDMSEETFFATSMTSLSGLAAVIGKAADISKEAFLRGMGTAWDNIQVKEIYDDN